MKKSILFVFIIQLALSACFKDLSFNSFLEEWDLSVNYENGACPSVTDAILFPEKWTREAMENFEEIPVETFRSMSTCGLLETLLVHPKNYLFGPFCGVCSNLFHPGVSAFNIAVSTNKITVELFVRDDCFSVLSSKYLSILNNKNSKDYRQMDYFEWLLASDLCMESLNSKEKLQLMAMALEKKFDKNLPKGENPSPEEALYFLSATPHIMIAIMRSFDYAPFMNETGANLVDGLWGYAYLNDHDIIEYAKQFLKEYKK